MGIKNLKTLIKRFSENGINEIHLSSLKGKSLAIDTSIFLYKFKYGRDSPVNDFIKQINHFRSWKFKK